LGCAFIAAIIRIWLKHDDNQKKTALSMPTKLPYVHLFFMDGIGMGGPDQTVNPFLSANMPALTALLGEDWFRPERGRIMTGRASLVPTDPNLGVPGRPQSATGQATILTGRNIPRLIGRHYGPKPNEEVAALIRKGTLFHEVVAAGQPAALISPYPEGYFAAINRGKRLYSAIPLAVTTAGLPLMTVDDLRAGRAVSPGFTGQGWREFLGYDDIPLLTLEQAGQQIARIARTYAFSFFEHWPSDRLGHRGTLAEAVAHLEMVDQVIGGLLAAWDDPAGLLIITSDHGNIEEKNPRQHTRNPVPTILVGAGHDIYARWIDDLTDIAQVVRVVLGL
jgi:hypothetical protein